MVYFQCLNATICGKKKDCYLKRLFILGAMLRLSRTATTPGHALGRMQAIACGMGSGQEESRVALSSKLNPMPTKSPVALESQPFEVATHVQVSMQAQNCGKRCLCLAIHIVGEREAALSHSPTAVRHKVISYDSPKVDSLLTATRIN